MFVLTCIYTCIAKCIRHIVSVLGFDQSVFFSADDKGCSIPYTTTFLVSSTTVFSFFMSASLILTIITILILNCANNNETDGTTNVKHSRRIRRLLTASFQLTGVTITILIPVVIFYTPVFKTMVYENFGNSLKLVTAVYLIMFVWTTPWCWFVEEDIHKQRKHDMLSDLEEGLAGSERKALIKKEKTVVEETKNVVVYGIEQPLSSAEKKTD